MCLQTDHAPLQVQSVLIGFVVVALLVSLVLNVWLWRTLQQVRHLASIDSLTHTLVRREALVRWAALKHKHPQQVHLCLADLDGLKRVNQTLGHVAGDRLLQEFAAQTQRNLKPEEWICRFGGDEFLVCVLGDSQGVQQRLFNLHQMLQPNVPFTYAISAVSPHSQLDEVVERLSLQISQSKQQSTPFTSPFLVDHV